MTRKVYVARKYPFVNGGETKGFFSMVSAQEWLEALIDKEPVINEWERTHPSIVDPDVTYQILSGEGEVAGSITEVPMEDTP